MTPADRRRHRAREMQLLELAAPHPDAKYHRERAELERKHRDLTKRFGNRSGGRLRSIHNETDRLELQRRLATRGFGRNLTRNI